jgi:hypothetical protein
VDRVVGTLAHAEVAVEVLVRDHRRRVEARSAPVV